MPLQSKRLSAPAVRIADCTTPAMEPPAINPDASSMPGENSPSAAHSPHRLAPLDGLVGLKTERDVRRALLAPVGRALVQVALGVGGEIRGQLPGGRLEPVGVLAVDRGIGEEDRRARVVDEVLAAR